jgi:peptide/nickel transport system substrate-binding protein
MNRKVVGFATMAAAAALAVAGCGSSGGSTSSGGGGGGTIIRGTTDQPISYDPAGVYDLPSWDGIVNIYQTLLTIPPGGNKPEPDAAQSCDFTNPTTYKCTLKPNNVFSDGSTLDSKDVKFSFDRNVKINDPQGAASLLANMQSISAPDSKTVIFNLKNPDATWPFVMTVQSFAIVPADGPNAYPDDKLQPSADAIGSGHYTVAQYEPGQQTVFQRNTKYTGDDPAKNDTAIVQYFDKPSALKLAIEQGDVDVGYRSFSPTDLKDLRNSDGVNVVGGAGTEIRYLVFNQNLMAGDNDAQKLAIRQAAAQTIDRAAIAKNVYDGTVTPLYSMVPQGLQFATTAFKDQFGAGPNLAAAKQTLQKAGVQTPVPLELWYTPSHYGAGSADEYAEIQHQLDDSGLFKVSLKSTEWNQYDQAALTNKYPEYQFGWFPDYPDANDYTTYFFAKNSFLNDGYSNPQMDKLLAQEVQTTNDSERAKIFDQIQQISAQDVPTIPIWQGGQVAAVRDGVTGVEDTFDSAYLFRLWVISKD